MTSKRRLERSIEDEADELAKSLGWWPLKFERIERSLPDKLYLGPGGQRFIVEWKRPGEKPRPQQVARIERLRKMGHHVYVLDNITAFRSVLLHEADAWRERLPELSPST